MQNIIDFLKKTRQDSLEQVNLMLLNEKQFINLAKDSSKGLAYQFLKTWDYESYYRHKELVVQSDILLQIVFQTTDLPKSLNNYRKLIADTCRNYKQSNSQCVNFQSQICNSVRQELVDVVTEISLSR